MKTAHLLAGLAFGDEGKGATTEFLVKKYQVSLVVRYNGGAQAAHNVVQKNGTQHTFAQFGSGSFVPGVATHLSRFVLVNPMSMMREAEHLHSLGLIDIWHRTTVENKALIITPFQAATNRILEKARGASLHGSCGIGIGQTRQFHLKYGDKALFAEDLKDEFLTRKKLLFIRESCIDTLNHEGAKTAWPADKDWQLFVGPTAKKDSISWCIERYKAWPAKIVDEEYLGKTLYTLHSDVVFEGAQGMLLDEKFGFAPHNTWTDITYTNANDLLATANYSGKVSRVGVIRSYFTRHGAGPFPTENKNLIYPESHNNSIGMQGLFRLGEFDWTLSRYANNAIGGVDVIAVNHLDVLTQDQRDSFIPEIKKWFHVEDLILGYGPCFEDRTFNYNQLTKKTLERITNVNIQSVVQSGKNA